MSENIFNEVEHHNVHFNLWDRSQSTFFLLFLPHPQIRFFKSSLFLIIKLIEFVFVEFCHDSEAASVEEEIKLFVVLFRLRSSLPNFSYFGFFLWLNLNWFYAFLCNFLFDYRLWHLVFESHKWHLNLLFISGGFLGDWRHFIFHLHLLNFGWSGFSYFLLLTLSLLESNSSFGFKRFVNITVFFLFVFRIFCSFYCYVRFLNLLFWY